MLLERDIFLNDFLKPVLTTLYTISIYWHLECKADKNRNNDGEIIQKDQIGVIKHDSRGWKICKGSMNKNSERKNFIP